jgi:trehalose synthase
MPEPGKRLVNPPERSQMLPKVSVGHYNSAMSTDVDNYRVLLGDEMVDELRSLARELKGTRICHINSTGYGGGVAELLSRYLPILQALKLSAEWRLIQARPEFFTVTKVIHNALQGADYSLDEEQKKLFLEVSAESAERLESEYDVFFVHDPQPVALRHFAGQRGAKWVWRCHIDTSSPNPNVAAFLEPFLREYDAHIFTLPDFLLPSLTGRNVFFIAPAIDPLDTKNMDLPLEICRRVIANVGVDLTRPLLVQVSRFDPWKDPVGVIETYRLVKQEIPGTQLALVGAIAGDDPEGWSLLERVHEESTKDPDLFVLTSLTGVGSMGVNIFQRGCDVVIQKSIREGFGLVVSEALWKEKPIVAGRAGGIPIQFPPGYERYLVSSIEECAAGVVELLHKPGARGEFGRVGREHVRRSFLLPRLIRDDLRVIRSLLT